MSSKDFLERYLGLLLGGALLVAVGFLAVTGQLTLYMHPRYVVFTVVMAVIAAVLSVVAAATLRPERDEHGDADHAPGEHHGREHQHEHTHATERSTRARTVLSLTWATVVVVATIALVLVAPPSALTAATAEARAVNSGAGAGSEVDAANVQSDQDLSTLTVADWASLLHQTSERSFYQGKRATLIGFTSPDPDDPENVFYLSRFVVTCCAVDAQAVGVPVYAPSWQQQWPAGTWLQLEGGFTANTSAKSSASLVLSPERSEIVPEPDTPYVF